MRDMMGQSLHHLRFSERAWESAAVRRSGFYSNRLRLSELVDLARRCGWRAEVDELNTWPHVPLPRAALARPYREMPDDELRVFSVRLILHPA